MSGHLRKPHCVVLLSVGFLTLANRNIIAATQRDYQVEILETTYHFGDTNSGEVKIHARLHAITAQGRANVSKIQISYVPAFQDVEFRYVKTLKKDGTVVNGDQTGAFDSKASDAPSAPAFTDLMVKTIVPPNLDTGDSVEYEALVRIRNWPKPDDFWFAHYLTTSVPVLSETVVLDLPAERSLALYESDSIRGKVEVANGRRIERWTTSNSESDKPSIEGAPALFAVSSILSWEAFGEWVNSLNRAAAEPTPEIAALATKLTEQKSSEKDRIGSLYSYVATKIRYVSTSFGLGRLQPHTASAVLHNAYGDCKDQTVLLSALLTAAGFKAHAVLTKPGLGVRFRDVPIPDQFNHEFTAVETKAGLVFLDPSMGPAPPQVMQTGVRGRSALLVSSPSSIIDIPIRSPVPARLVETLKGKVTAAGAFEGSGRVDVQGLPELVFRRVFLDGTDAEKESFMRGLAGPELRSAKVRQVLSSDPSDLSAGFWAQCELSQSDFFPPAQTSIKLIFDLPASPAQFLEAVKKPDQPLPVEPYSGSRGVDLIVDPSLTITNTMPVHLKTAFGSFDSEFSYKGGHLLLTRSVALNGTAIAPADWEALLGFLRSAQSEVDRGFTLERKTVPQVSSSRSPLARLLEEGAKAFRKRDFEGAMHAYLEATKLDPQSRSAWKDLGRTYANLREYAEAEKAYKRQIEINPNDPYAYNYLGILYRALNREDDAILWFRKQIAVSPLDRYAHDNLTVSYVAQHRWEEARAEAAIATEISPEDATMWARLGKTQLMTGHHEEANKSFDRALNQPHDAMLENNIAFAMAESGFQLDKAWQLVYGTLNPEANLVCQPETLSKDDKCSAQLRRVGNMLDTAGWVLYRQGKYAEAEPYLSSAYAIGDREAVEIHMSALLAKLERFDESLKYFADARSRPEFTSAEANDLRNELAKAVGGEIQLDSRLDQLQLQAKHPGVTASVLTLVDERGKVLEAEPGDPQTPPSLVTEAKSLGLLPIAWPDHSIRSIRTIEFGQDGSKWVLKRSYVWRTPVASAAR